jgi:hypothetical protein
MTSLTWLTLRRWALLNLILMGLGLSLFALLSVGGPSTHRAQAQEPAPTGENSYCLVCHQDQGNLTANSAHGIHKSEQAVGCVDCHGANVFPHVGDVLGGVQQACQDCHTEPAQQVQLGTHAEGKIQGEIGAATCSSCHVAHQVALIAEGGLSCLACHRDTAATWQLSTHAQSFAYPSFQTGTAPADCLACHTTGFEAASATYQHASVACEACHGATPSNHPDEVKSVAWTHSADTCEGCHQQTVQEWRASGHGTQQLACSTCHQVHENSLRFETVSNLCLNCHDGDRDSFTHITHAKQECDSCHLLQHEDEAAIALHLETGALASSGHDNIVQTQACTDCHADEAAFQAARQLPDVPHPALAAQLETEALQADLEATRQEGAETAAVRLAQGAVLGLGLGNMFALLLLRYLHNRRLSHQNGDHPTTDGGHL